MIEIRRTALDGVLEIVPRKFCDDRGFFSEVYNANVFREAGIDLVFVQDNHSKSVHRGVLRGLHYQLPPHAQDKLVRVASGAILDVAVDLRRSSPGFGQWTAVELSAEKWNQLLVPKGFAHGFVTLSENTEVLYKVTDVHSPADGRAIRFDDPHLAIRWPFEAGALILSDKDRQAPLLEAADVFD